MTIKDLELLYDYGYWANGKLVPIEHFFSDAEL
jgi:hypothetical protein